MTGTKELLEMAIKEMNIHLEQDEFYSSKNEHILTILKEAIDLAYQVGRSDEKYFLRGPRTIKLYDK